MRLGDGWPVRCCCGGVGCRCPIVCLAALGAALIEAATILLSKATPNKVEAHGRTRRRVAPDLTCLMLNNQNYHNILVGASHGIQGYEPAAVTLAVVEVLSQF